MAPKSTLLKSCEKEPRQFQNWIKNLNGGSSKISYFGSIPVNFTESKSFYFAGILPFASKVTIEIAKAQVGHQTEGK